jgi:hypothetical protein
MICQSLTRPQSRNPIVPALICAVIVMAALTYTSHAVLQHGQYAEAVRKCLENQPPLMQLQNPLTGRVAKVCPLKDHFGIQIVEGDREVTSFPNKSKTLDKVVEYLFHAGYTGVP